MRTRAKEYAQGYYIHEEDIKGMHAIMGIVERDSNGIRDKQEHVTMRILEREVQRYIVDNENIMKYQEEILHILNMLQKKFNKYSGTRE
jgi:hypothetical protein